MSFKTKYRPVIVLAPGVLAGAEKVVLTGLHALQEAGLNPLMVVIRETRIPQYASDFQKMIPAGIESVVVDSTKALDFKLPFRIKISLEKEKLPIVFHSHGFKALIACYMIKGKRAHIHTHHGNTAHTLKVRIYEKIAFMTMKTCNLVVAVSEKMKHELEMALAPFNKIIVIENMLSLSNAPKIREARNNHKKENDDTIRLIFIGRLSPEKGLLDFLSYWNSFDQKTSFHLTVLGDGIERVAAEKFVSENNLSEHVVFHGFVSGPSLYLTEPDLLIMPSHREGLPMTLIEALASGIPVISNDVGAISSLVKNNHNGYFAKTPDCEGWIDVFQQTLMHLSKWQENAVREAESIEERFSSKLWAAKTQNSYENKIKS